MKTGSGHTYLNNSQLNLKVPITIGAVNRLSHTNIANFEDNLKDQIIYNNFKRYLIIAGDSCK